MYVRLGQDHPARIAAGTLPAYRCGKRAIRINLEDLEATPRQIPSARW